MADVIAATFDGPDEAEAALRTIRGLEDADKIKPSDTAVVRKDADGKITIHNEAGSGTEAGAVIGAVLGGLLFVVFPLAGIAAGAAAGGLIGRAASPGHRWGLGQAGLRRSAARWVGTLPPDPRR